MSLDAVDKKVEAAHAASNRRGVLKREWRMERMMHNTKEV